LRFLVRLRPLIRIPVPVELRPRLFGLRPVFRVPVPVKLRSLFGLRPMFRVPVPVKLRSLVGLGSLVRIPVPVELRSLVGSSVPVRQGPHVGLPVAVVSAVLFISVIELRIPVVAIMFAVLEIAAFPDFIPVTPSDRRWKIPVSDRNPRTAKTRATIPAAVPEYEELVPGLDDVIVPSIGDGKAVVVQVDEIRVSVDNYNRASPKVDI
jgi:hypothetical protein